MHYKLVFASKQIKCSTKSSFSFQYFRGSSRIKEMYDIEMNEATKLIDETRRDAANSNIQQQRAEKDLRDQTARYNRIKNLRETDRREIDALQLQISENEAVRKDFSSPIYSSLLPTSKSLYFVVVLLISMMKPDDTKPKLNV